MTDFLLEFLNFNQNVDFGMVTNVIIAYLALLWVFVSIWVFNDARNRFGNIFVSVLMGLLNLVLFLPFLFIYLLVRPAHREEIEDWYDGGVNVPLVNFVGDEGVALSIELKVNSKKLANAIDPEMKINVSFDSQDENKQLVKSDVDSEQKRSRLDAIKNHRLVKKIKSSAKERKASNSKQSQQGEEKKVLNDHQEGVDHRSVKKKKKKKSKSKKRK